MDIFNLQKIFLCVIGTILTITSNLVLANIDTKVEANSKSNTIGMVLETSPKIKDRYKDFLDYLEQKKINYSIKNNYVYIDGDLSLNKKLKFVLPDNLLVAGDLDLSNSQIKQLPENLFIGGDLILNDTRIIYLPESLYLSGSLRGVDVEKIYNIAYRKSDESDNLILFAVFINGEIKISMEEFGFFLFNLKSFEKEVDENYSDIVAEEYKRAARECFDELTEMRKKQTSPIAEQIQNMQEQYKDFFDFLHFNKVKYSFKNNTIIIFDDLYLNKHVSQLPNNLFVEGDFNCQDSNITQLPDNLTVNGRFNLNQCFHIISELPKNLFVNTLDLSGSFITDLPNDLHVNNLYVNSGFINQLPDNFSVAENLDLKEVPIATLPNNLHVGESLSLNNTLISRLPENLSVGKSFTLGNLDIKRINNIVYRENVGENKITIFSVFVNGEIQLSVPSWAFLGNLKLFETKVDEIYPEISGEKYKLAARECIKKLAEMRENEIVVNRTNINNKLFTHKIDDNIILSSKPFDSIYEMHKDFFNYLNKREHEYLVKNDSIYILGGMDDPAMDLSDRPITQLPNKLFIGGRFDISNTMLTKLPDVLYVHGTLDASNTFIKELPDNLFVSSYLFLNNTQITKLPNNLSIHGSLELSNTFITQLPDYLSVIDLDISNTKVTQLPNNLSVKKSLNLSNTQINQLPDNLLLEGNLDISNTPITKLPNTLSVKYNLKLNNTKITKLPEKLFVGKSLHLDVTNIENIAYREHLGEDDITLFSVFVNGEIQLSVPAWEFLGNLKTFEVKIDEKFSNDLAAQYKQWAKECVEELIKMRNTYDNIQ